MFKRVIVTAAAAASVLGGAAPASAQQIAPCHGEASSCPLCLNVKGDVVELVYCVLNVSQAQPAPDGTP